MPGFMEQLRDNLSEISMGKKILLMMLLAGGLSAVSVIWLWVQKPDFRILYTNLSSEDAGSVVTKFKELNVPYEFSNDGKSLLVPAERVHELRLLLAGEGLPQGSGVGFEIFDQSTFGTTEFAQKLNYRRALQGELARTISQLHAVNNARVHLVIPEPRLFSNQEELTRAAVVVNLKPGKILTDAQVRGITHLVSGSVEGLKSESVTIVDGQGKIRSTGSEGSSSVMMSSNQLEFQKNLEQQIQKTIQSMLEKVVGPGKALVRVSSIIDLRQIELTEEKFDPETPVVRSEQRSQGNVSGQSQSTRPSGAPGVTSNVPPGTQGSAGGANNRNSSDNTSEVINYEISKIVSHVVEPFGTIKRLSVAALIDGTYEEVTDEEGVTSQKYIARGEEEMVTLTAIVRKAMGFSAVRKDELEVVNIPFKNDQSLDLGEAPAESITEKLMQWMPLVRQILGPILILLVLAMIVRPIIKAALTQIPHPVPLAAVGQELPFVEETPQLPPGPSTDEIIELTENNPQLGPTMVRKWVKEDE